MNKPKIPIYLEGEIEEVVIPDRDSSKAIVKSEEISSEQNETTLGREVTASARPDEEEEQQENAIFSFICSCGEYFCYVATKCVMLPVMFILWLLKFLWKHTVLFRDAIVRMAKALFDFVASPFIKTGRAAQRAARNIREARKSGDKGMTLKLYMLFIKEALFGKRGIAVTLFNYIAPIIALSFLVSVVGYATNTNYAIKMSVNGKFVGYIQNEQVFTDAERIMQERITYMDSEQTLVMTPEYSLEMLGDQPYITKYQLANKMMEISDEPIEYAFGMYIGTKFYGALVDKTAVEQKTAEILDSYRTDSAPDEEVAFEKEITYVPGLYMSESIVSTEEIIELITSRKREAAYYTVEEGDSHYGICEKLGITLDELEELNPGILDDDYVLRVGTKLLKTQEVPFLSVSISRTEVYDVDVPYDTEYTTDDDHYEGVNTVVQQGEYGTNEITAKVYYVNGEEVKRTIITTVRTKDPVTEIVSRGTLPPQSSHYSDEELEYDMKYIWPVNGGTFWEWSQWDGGYYGHRGIDIGAPYGTDIYAGAGGVVSYAGWNWGGLGYCVMIDHPDGYTTVYAHCSDLFVYEGQEVVQGQCIAAMGETGYAFGVHLHFEVRLGNERLNPRYYVNGLQALYNAGVY